MKSWHLRWNVRHVFSFVNFVHWSLLGDLYICIMSWWIYLQGLMNSLYSQPFSHYNSQPLNLQPPQQQAQQGQGSQTQKIHYSGWKGNRLLFVNGLWSFAFSNSVCTVMCPQIYLLDVWVFCEVSLVLPLTKRTPGMVQWYYGSARATDGAVRRHIHHIQGWQRK